MVSDRDLLQENILKTAQDLPGIFRMLQKQDSRSSCSTHPFLYIFKKMGQFFFIPTSSTYSAPISIFDPAGDPGGCLKPATF